MPPDVSYASRLDASAKSAGYQNFETSYFEYFPAIQRILAEKDLSQVLQIICEEAVGVLGANRSMLLRLTANGGHEVAGSHGMPEAFTAAAAAHRGPSVLRDILKRGEIEVVPEVSRDFRSFQQDVSGRSGHVTLCAIPLEAAGAPIGGLFIYFLRRRNFTLHERRLAASFGQLAALMIEKAELVGSLESRIDEQRSLERALRHIASNQKVEEIIQAVLSESKPIMGTDRCSVMLPHQKTGELRLFVGQGISASFVEKLAALPEPFPLGARYVSNPSMDKPTIIPDATQDPVFGKIQAEEGNRTMAAFPLRLNDQNMGALFFFWPHSQEVDPQKIALGQAFAYEVAIAFEKARLYEEERDSRNFLMSVVGDAADAVIITNFDRKITLWNTGAENIYGYTKEEALGSHITLIIPERIRDHVLKNGSRVRAHKESVLFEAPMRAKSGREIPASIALSPVSDEDGNIVAVASIHKDLSERNRAEQSLRESEERLRSIYDAANDAIFLIDMESQAIVETNPRASRMLGYTREELVGMPIQQIHPHETPLLLSMMNELREGRVVRTDRLSCMTKSKEVIPAEISFSSVEIKGQPLVMAIVRDITERLRAEKERESYVEHLKALNSLTQKITTSLDLGAVFRDIVASAASLLDVPFVHIYIKEGENLLLRARSHQAWEIGIGVLKLGQGGAGWVAEHGEILYIEDIHADPRWYFRRMAVENRLRSFLGIPLISDGNVYGVLSGLTQEKRAFTKDEYELISAFANAASIALQNAEVHSRLEASFEELRKQQKMIVRAEKLSSLGVLAAGAAHEILNPANIISIRAQRLAEKSIEGTPANKAAGVILHHVQRISRICDDLRRFSRDEAPAMAPFDPEEALGESIRLVESELRMAGIECDLDLRGGHLAVHGDSHQLQQVFVNLLSNAQDAMPAGGRLRLASQEIEEDGKKWWEVRFSDSGAGIPEDIQDQIFDPFFTTKPEDRGTGLGLSVSHGIIENHGGKIWVESNPDQGATFYVRLEVI